MFPPTVKTVGFHNVIIMTVSNLKKEIKHRSFKRIIAITVFMAMIFSFNSLYGSIKKENEQFKRKIYKLEQQNKELNEKMEDLRRQAEAKNGEYFIITAYDLSVESCGKTPEHPAYGVTASGMDLSGHTLESARAVAVDPTVIALGSNVKIEFFDDSMKQFNGIYKAVDTGGDIKGNRIDLFAGEDAYELAMSIGRREALVEVI